MSYFWQDWLENPNSNDLLPPQGAPEGMLAKANPSVARQIMAACRQIGDLLNTVSVDDPDHPLGTMATQDSDAVAITGGVVAGNGSGYTNLNAGAFVTGKIPVARIGPSTYSFNVTGNAAGALAADSLDGAANHGLLPIGAIVWSMQSVAPTGWHICDGTSGTPNLAGAHPIGALNDAGVGVISGIAGGWNPATDAAGNHSHVIGNYALTIADIPLHGHPMRIQATGQPVGQPTGGVQMNTGANSLSYPSFTGAPTNTVGQQVGGTGGGATHNHTGGTAAPTHTHTVSSSPVKVGLTPFMRIS